MSERTNLHHILFDSASWESRATSKHIRRDSSLIVPLDIDAHAELHKEIPLVPLLGHYAMQDVANMYKPGKNYLNSVENLQRSIERAGKTPKAHQLERDLGELTIHALDLQKPYLKDVWGDDSWRDI